MNPYYESERVKLYCGDAREILGTLDEVDSCVTDPPFGMGFQSNHRIVDHKPIAGDGCEGLLMLATQIPVRHSRYVFCRWDNLSIIKPRSLITWVKNNWSMGDLDHEHARQTEVIAFWPGPDHAWPDKRPADVIHHPRSGNVNHPTEKTESLMEEVCGWTSGTILDPFMGSGTTGVAAVRLGRKFIGIEIDEGYCKIAVRRIREAEQAFALFDPPVPETQAEMFPKSV